jgi:hypothetical protein
VSVMDNIVSENGQASPAKASLCDRRVELKFFLDPATAAAVRDWATERLVPDEFCDPAVPSGYRVTTLYLDTPDWDIYHRRSDIIDGKHRIRRYGAEPVLWLEKKRKSRDVVRKLRCAIAQDEIGELLADPRPDAGAIDDGGSQAWPGDWFRDCVRQMSLAPAVVVRYQRFARVGDSPRGPVRLTIDSDIRGGAAGDLSVPTICDPGAELLPDGQILELKFTEHLPSVFKELLYEFRIGVTAFSKYRSSVARAGLVE